MSQLTNQADDLPIANRVRTAELGGSALHVLGRIGRSSFGLGSVAVDLVLHQTAEGLRSTFWCVDSADEIEWVVRTAGLPADRIRRFHSHMGKLSYSPDMEHAVKMTAATELPIVIHQLSLWTALSRVTERWRRYGVPTVVSAQGTLDRFALSKSRWKKKLAMLAYEARNLERASCLQACGDQEVANYRDLGLKNPIAVVPNGISAKWMNSRGDPLAFRAKYEVPGDVRIMLFISRITPKKGLPMLIEALSGLKRHLREWIVLIAGVDECDHQAAVEELIHRHDLERYVRVIGPVYGDDKRNAYEAADLFVLPTHSEGNPMVVLEALGAGVPVVTTRGAPWRDLVPYQCGWWTEISTDAIGQALAEALQMPQSALAARGLRGLELVRRNYDWSQIARQTIRLYEWLGGRGPQPGFVFTC
jgi:glycosyltransferase involved in cell wall biosynthesis